ncbi:MAG: methyltransferase domain-containing protein [Gammaproteobacteria bacterium]|nr:methyltransferase domain-containing protein [Gammaproteobacteria bacterium]
MSGRPHQGKVAGTRWDPAQYLAFADYRLRPALELLARVPAQSPSLVYDLGCGTGNVTRLIAERWPDAEVHGLDSSAEMLERAAAESARVTWTRMDIAAWRSPRPADVIYSNATLHWLDDHESLFPRLLDSLAPGGCLAVQMPLSWDMPSHILMRATLADGGARGGPIGPPELRAATARKWVHEPWEYYDMLAGRVASLDIWASEYLQVLEGEDPVLEWVKATGLRPVLNGLGEAERETFLDAYARRLRRAYPRRADGHTLYPFRRLFIVAIV